MYGAGTRDNSLHDISLFFFRSCIFENYIFYGNRQKKKKC